MPENMEDSQKQHLAVGSDEEWGSHSLPMSQISSWSDENMDTVVKDFNAAVQTLGQGEISPLKYRVRRDLDTLQPSSLRSIKRKASQTVNLVLEAIAPGQSSKLLKMIQQPMDETEGSDDHLQQVIIDLYMESSDRCLKKQLLSMIASQHTKSKLQQMIPGVTLYAIDEARKHALQFGAGNSIPRQVQLRRQRMDKDKLDHALDFFFDPTFHQVTAFGTKNMKTSTGKIMTIPSVVRTAYHSTLVDTYIAYCKETDFEPLSKASLFRILSECPASKRTNLKGLDNIAADGNSAFETLISIIEEMEKNNITQITELKECKEKMQSCKMFYKTEYKMHVQKESNCADHCLNYALSDVTNQNLHQSCNHDHDMECTKCSDCGNGIINLKSLISENNELTADKKVEYLYDIEMAEKNIDDWKSHIVRGVAQDQCRKDLFENLADNEVVMIMDWAMKFLPMMYREKQSDWFGQKGFNWHVVVCVFKDMEDNLKHCTYVHVMDTAKQDWYSVACLLHHVLITLKKERPEVETAFIRSDNAGCYHCSNLWNCLPEISCDTGVEILRYDFSESQNGKSYCDSKIAHMRGKLRKHVKSGGNVVSAADMKSILDSGNDVPGCQIAHVEIKSPEIPCISHKIKDITKISNVKFNNRNITITFWKNYNIGKGQDLSLVTHNFTSTLTIISDFKTPYQNYGIIKHVTAINEHQADDTTNMDFELPCPDPLCTTTMKSYSELSAHC